jgi:hypothetical protein
LIKKTKSKCSQCLVFDKLFSIKKKKEKMNESLFTFVGSKFNLSLQINYFRNTHTVYVDLITKRLESELDRKGAPNKTPPGLQIGWHPDPDPDPDQRVASRSEGGGGGGIQIQIQIRGWRWHPDPDSDQRVAVASRSRFRSEGGGGIQIQIQIRGWRWHPDPDPDQRVAVASRSRFRSDITLTSFNSILVFQ